LPGAFTSDVSPIFTPADPNAVIQGLWVGHELSVMEQLSISSFLLNGHQYHLYVYDKTRNVPMGTVLRDANEILPSSRIFRYRDRPSYAGFANFFRYKLLLERGGWWADTDVVCLKPFDVPEAQVFASELVGDRDLATNGIIKAPIGSRAMAYAWEVCQTKRSERLRWGETGPVLLRKTIEALGLESNQRPHHVFCPLAYPAWFKALEPGSDELLDDRSHAIHLWNEMWRTGNRDKNAQYPVDCLYEHLKERYLRLPCHG
jgi:hypothetical protein